MIPGKKYRRFYRRRCALPERLNRKKIGALGMCFLNLHDPEVNRLISKAPLLDKILPPATHASAFFPGVRAIKIPMKWVSKMSALVNNPEALKILLKDKYSAGASISFKFGSTFMSYKPDIPFDEFDRCPVLLAQPDDDRWTPLAASQKFMDQLQVKKKIIMLENAGHYPMETPGLNQLEKGMVDFIRSL